MPLWIQNIIAFLFKKHKQTSLPCDCRRISWCWLWGQITPDPHKNKPNLPNHLRKSPASKDLARKLESRALSATKLSQLSPGSRVAAAGWQTRSRGEVARGGADAARTRTARGGANADSDASPRDSAIRLEGPDEDGVAPGPAPGRRSGHRVVGGGIYRYSLWLNTKHFFTVRLKREGLNGFVLLRVRRMTADRAERDTFCVGYWMMRGDFVGFFSSPAMLLMLLCVRGVFLSRPFKCLLIKALLFGAFGLLLVFMKLCANSIRKHADIIALSL